jgi:hypothetical protein
MPYRGGYRGGYRGDSVVYIIAPVRNNFVPLSFIKLVYSYTWKVSHRSVHPPKNEKVLLDLGMVM